MHNHLSFAVVRKRTPYQKHKEKEEEKKKRADEEAAKLYEEFVESFKADEEKPGHKTFVRGGTIMPGTNAPPVPPAEGAGAGLGGSSTGNTGKKSGGQYVPSFIPPSMVAAMKADEEAKAMAKEPVAESELTLPSRKAEKGKPKNIDLMLETLKRDQELREERFKSRREGRATGFDVFPDDNQGSFADGDPYTTNLYVGNLAPDVDEDILKKEFGRFGAIASVKIMWPRDEDQRRRGRNCGFVAFMRREDAQRAQEKLNGEMLHEYELRIGWGKSVPIPPVPIYPPPSAETLRKLQHPGMSAMVQQHLPKPKEEAQGVGPDIEVQIPADGHVRYIVDLLASYVLRDGCAFEQVVMEREVGNPMFSFLFDLQSPEHAYYRWKLFSLAEDDSMRSWQIDPFVMVAGGPRWIPPAMCIGDGSQLTAAQKGGDGRDRFKGLSDFERDKFEDMLRSLRVDRQSICDAMVFALNNADAASEVVDILFESLTLAETPLGLKVARLFLVSDILHNSTAPVRNASQYRSKLEDRLADVFESFHLAYTALDSKTEQEATRRHVLRVLRIWRDWFIFSNDYLNGLQATFLHGGASAAADAPQNAALAAELHSLPDEDIERRCRQNGLSIHGGRPAQLCRLLGLDAYLHGEPQLELDVSSSHRRDAAPDKAPIAAPPATSGQDMFDDAGEGQGAGQGADPGSPTRGFGNGVVGPGGPEGPRGADVDRRASAWTAVDEQQERRAQPEGPISKWLLEEQDDARGGDAQQISGSSEKIFSDAGSTPVIQSGVRTPVGEERPPGPEHREEGAGGAARMDEEELRHRQRMRKVEMDVMVFREDLEDQGLDKDEVEARVAGHRATLLAASERPDGPKETERSGEKERDRGRDRGRDREREREKDRSRHKSRGKEGERREKGPGREREKGGRDRGDARGRDRRKQSGGSSPRSGSAGRSRSPRRGRTRATSGQRRRSRSRSARSQKGRRSASGHRRRR
ncbi:unnamed protein product [Ostreobium quekettii]|uniref:U2 snRNP-associated SURP motif-containing protein n=1 Tax=Ostreobium quekettii TaxID=121088 RepID=A0A8S1J3U9_9CHLO|nr:unnamed protein product [Ostreobium quekettii]|eukprot:evm.model.scf_1079EXC.3 EVM.evm.TU.scf_1079EXC.3   scf_1079EXC:13236-19540(+)